MIDGLAGLPTTKGTVIFVCRTCFVPPEWGLGSNEGHLIHLFVCPRCQKFLGEWSSIQERDQELADLAQKVEIINKPKP